MAAFSGEKGAVTLTANHTGWGVNVQKWSVNIAQEMLDVTALPGGTAQVWKTFVAGVSSWSGSFEGFIDATTVPDEAAFDAKSGTATFEDGHDNTYVGTVFLSDCDVENDVGGAAVINCNFQGTGTMAITSG